MMAISLPMNLVLDVAIDTFLKLTEPFTSSQWNVVLKPQDNRDPAKLMSILS
jgi:hypothetical protein